MYIYELNNIHECFVWKMEDEGVVLTNSHNCITYIAITFIRVSVGAAFEKPCYAKSC